MDFLSADEVLNNDFSEYTFIPLEHMLKLSSQEDWLDIIYSSNPEDLWNLTDDNCLIYGIKKLTSKQRAVLYLRVIKGYSNKDIAEQWETTDRNIRKHYANTVKKLRDWYIKEREKNYDTKR